MPGRKQAGQKSESGGGNCGGHKGNRGDFTKRRGGMGRIFSKLCREHGLKMEGGGKGDKSPK